MAFNLTRQSEFISFDGAVSATTEHQRPDRYRHIEALEKDTIRIGRGGGYSYSAASFGRDILVQEMTAFNRLLEFDSTNLTLKTEPGIRLLDLLKWAIERRLYFPVIPGYPFITVGGCVAADVHGKNPHRDGTFSEWVKEITVYHPTKGYQELSADSNPDLFALTCGGFGLTGIITSVTLQLIPLPAYNVQVARIPVQSIRQAVQAIARADMDFCYSWHDATPTARYGKGIVVHGKWGEAHTPGRQPRFRHMTPRSRAMLPFSIWNATTAATANLAFNIVQKLRVAESQEHIIHASFPLASNPYYHMMFGKPGLREAQLLIPDRAVDQFAEQLEELVRRINAPTMMISIKRFKGQQKSLSQSGQGYLIAIDCYLNRKTEPFFNALDDLMISHGGQPNLTKDSRLSKTVAMQSIVNYQEFSAKLRLYDPLRLYRSELSTRLGL